MLTSHSTIGKKGRHHSRFGKSCVIYSRLIYSFSMNGVASIKSSITTKATIRSRTACDTFDCSVMGKKGDYK